MIHFFMLIIIVAILTAISLFSFKTIPILKKTVVVGGILISSGLAILMQGSFAWHMSLLAILGLSLVTALIFMKIEEREQQEKERLKQERKDRKKQAVESPKPVKPEKETEKVPEPKTEPVQEKSEKVFGMESISPVGKGN